ncbi:YpjP family protein [Oceanobacillus sp. CAU 1775]
MKLWMKKIAVVMVAILTLGTYTPAALLDIHGEDNKNNLSSKSDSVTVEKQQVSDYQTTLQEEVDYLASIQAQAKAQSLLKFGPRIAEQVEDEFISIILPQIETVLADLFAEADEDTVPYYGITENPANGYGERIFNVTDLRTEEDLAKFHVRRDNRPLDGYYFNFHYHLSNDGFKEHHHIGDIYWDKNTPPKWMA